MPQQLRLRALQLHQQKVRPQLKALLQRKESRPHLQQKGPLQRRAPPQRRRKGPRQHLQQKVPHLRKVPLRQRAPHPQKALPPHPQQKEPLLLRKGLQQRHRQKAHHRQRSPLPHLQKELLRMRQRQRLRLRKLLQSPLPRRRRRRHQSKHPPKATQLALDDIKYIIHISDFIKKRIYYMIGSFLPYSPYIIDICKYIFYK
ncbi:uncharacterized protein LOC134741703 [Cydia strobilella]|uniref:uncharacterized protein LOC134741703 n=1 Tax=Cydia strobilella TaxID=1100964 RepID=UPI0030046F15